MPSSKSFLGIRNTLKRPTTIFFAAIVMLGWMSSVSLAQLRVVTYNTATSGENFSPNTPRAGMRIVLEAIGEESRNGIARPIDVLLLQEQENVNTSTQAITEILNEAYGAGIYARGRLNGGTNGGGRAGIVYNTQTVDLIQERAFGRLASTAQARQTVRYQLRPIGYTDQSDIYAFVNHYKSGTSATDQQRRNVEAQAIRNNARELGSTAHLIYAGDFNIRSCTEEMFQTLLADGIGQAVDPVEDFAQGCQWNNNSAFRGLHTQSPADGSHSGLIQGGVDDRFDFQLVTTNLLDDQGLSMIPNSYHVLGNNGSHRLNDPINSSTNNATTTDVLNALARTSDHLPVIADYQLPAIMNVIASPLPTRVLQGAPLIASFTVSNAAPVAHPAGADALDYTIGIGTNISPFTSQSGVSLAATEIEPLVFTMPTVLAGEVSYGVNITSTTTDALNRNFSTAGSYSVIAPSLPSLLPQQTIEAIEISHILPLDRPSQIPLSIYNRAEAGGAALNLDNLSFTETSVFSTTLEPFVSLSPHEQQDFLLDIDTSQLGQFDSQLALGVSDELGIFGRRFRELFIDVTIRVAFPGDADLDDSVGFADFLILSDNFGGKGTWANGDFNNDSDIDFADFLLLSGNFGLQNEPISVPEPSVTSSLGMCLIAVVFLRLRSRLKGPAFTRSS